MKRRMKKLALHRETLVKLDASCLEMVMGEKGFGAGTADVDTCPRESCMEQCLPDTGTP